MEIVATPITSPSTIVMLVRAYRRIMSIHILLMPKSSFTRLHLGQLSFMSLSPCATATMITSFALLPRILLLKILHYIAPNPQSPMLLHKIKAMLLRVAASPNRALLNDSRVEIVATPIISPSTIVTLACE
jgi:hypothetical protein